MLLTLAATSLIGSILAAVNPYLQEEKAIMVKFLLLLSIHAVIPFIWIGKNKEMKGAMVDALKVLKII